MKKEKSCGALIFLEKEGKIEKLLLIKHRHGGHWSFPKGHVEGCETEKETALREIKEETGKTVTLLPGFREKLNYSPKPNVQKDVIYFLAVTSDDSVTIQEEEISSYVWMDVDKAFYSVSFSNDRNLISKATSFLSER